MIQFQNLIYVIDQLQVRYFNSLRYKEKAPVRNRRGFFFVARAELEQERVKAKRGADMF
jgi:hypothetical protein